MDDKNIYHLPLKNEAKRRVLKEKILQNQNKLALVMSILSLIVLTVYTNQKVVYRNIEVIDGQRLLASTESNYESEDSVKFEQSMAVRFAKQDLRTIASAKAAPLDQLVYGDLRGLYAVRMQSGLITELEYTNSGQSPVVIKDAAAFVKKYKEFFAPQASDVLEVKKSSEAQETPSFVLMDKEQKEMARIQLQMNDIHGLISLKIIK